MSFRIVPPSASSLFPDDARKTIQNIYETGLQNLQKMFGPFGATG